MKRLMTVPAGLFLSTVGLLLMFSCGAVACFDATLGDGASTGWLAGIAIGVAAYVAGWLGPRITYGRE